MNQLIRNAARLFPRFFIAWHEVEQGICLVIMDATNPFDLGKYYIVEEVEIWEFGLPIIKDSIIHIAETYYNGKPVRSC
jgi:hypothetical protein